MSKNREDEKEDTHAFNTGHTLGFIVTDGAIWFADRFGAGWRHTSGGVKATDSKIWDRSRFFWGRETCSTTENKIQHFSATHYIMKIQIERYDYVLFPVNFL